MGERLEQIVLKYAPEYWQIGVSSAVDLTLYSQEYNEISGEVLNAMQYRVPIKSIQRFQNVHDLGQFLIREQHLLHINPGRPYYRVSESHCHEIFINNVSC